MNDSREGSLSLGEKFALRVFALRCSNTQLPGPRRGSGTQSSWRIGLCHYRQTAPLPPHTHPSQGRPPKPLAPPVHQMAPRLRASHGAAAQLAALPASSQSHSPAALAVPELEVRNLSNPPPRARHTPTPCFLGRLTLPQISKSHRAMSARDNEPNLSVRCFATSSLPSNPPTPPTPFSRVCFCFFLRRGK